MGQTSFPPEAILVSAAGVIGATAAGQCVNLTAAQVRSFASVYSTAQVDTALAAKADKATTLAGYGITDGQPLDADLTAIAALSTTTYGRSLLTGTDAAATRSSLGLGTMATQAATAYAALAGASFTGPVSVSGYIDATSIRCDGSQVFDTLTSTSLDVGSAGGFRKILLGNGGVSTAPIICLGGVLSDCPAIKRNGTAINFRLADDSADADITAKTVGIGTSGTPEAKLDIVNGASAHTTSSVNHYRNVASYAGTATGTMKIALPKLASNTMLNITVRGYQYNPNDFSDWEVHLSGYNFSTGWFARGAEIRGNAPFTKVRFGDDGTHNLILLGDTSTAFNFAAVVITDVVTHQSNITGWGSGWSISVVSSESGISNISTSTVRTGYTLDLGTLPTAVPANSSTSRDKYTLQSNNILTRFGQVDLSASGYGYPSYVQAGNIVADYAFYALLLQPLGGNVVLGASTDDGVNKLQITGSSKIGALTLTDSFEPASKTKATLPNAAANAKKRFVVTDSTPVVNRIAFSNGSAWYYEDGTAV